MRLLKIDEMAIENELLDEDCKLCQIVQYCFQWRNFPNAVICEDKEEKGKERKRKRKMWRS